MENKVLIDSLHCLFILHESTLFSDCFILFSYEAIVNIPAPTGLEPPVFESAIPLCVEVTSQNSLHCTAAIERLIQPLASTFNSLEITPERSHSGKKEKIN